MSSSGGMPVTMRFQGSLRIKIPVATLITAIHVLIMGSPDEKKRD